MVRALVTVAYLVGAVLSVAGFYRPRRLKWAAAVVTVGWVSQVIYLVQIGQMTKEIPVVSLGPWMAVLVWMIVSVALASVWWAGGRYQALAGFLLPVSAVFWLVDLALADAAGRLPRSAWLPVHIVAATMAVVALLLAAVFGLMYTEKERELRLKSVDVFYYRLPALQEMDHWSVRFAAIGLGLWILALVAGQLSARAGVHPLMVSHLAAAWSVLTAAMYGLYFVMRGRFGWRGRPAAVMVMVLFLFVVINLLALHLHWSPLRAYNLPKRSGGG